jgi:hypothetical protein
MERGEKGAELIGGGTERRLSSCPCPVGKQRRSGFSFFEKRFGLFLDRKKYFPGGIFPDLAFSYGIIGKSSGLTWHLFWLFAKPFPPT